MLLDLFEKEICDHTSDKSYFFFAVFEAMLTMVYWYEAHNIASIECNHVAFREVFFDRRIIKT